MAILLRTREYKRDWHSYVIRTVWWAFEKLFAYINYGSLTARLCGLDTSKARLRAHAASVLSLIAVQPVKNPGRTSNTLAKAQKYHYPETLLISAIWNTPYCF